jgi:catechol 2,3-dioxygenase-like lactoylglutathione lyase family enzyme
VALRGAVLFAKDIERMTRFYRDGFGLSIAAGSVSEGFVDLRSSGGRLLLHAIPPHIAKDIHIESPPKPRADTAIKLVFEAPDVATARANLSSCGAQMRDVSQWGSCDGVDPEGNVFQVVKA